MSENKENRNECVEVNIFVKCKDGSWRREHDTHCVVVNIHADCEECGKRKNPCNEY